MEQLRISHRTSYFYHTPVTLGPHRLIVRPRETCDVTLESFRLEVSPDAAISWAQDIFGNCVAMAAFTGLTDRLVITSTADVQLHAVKWPVFNIAASAISYPFSYTDDEWADLGALTVPGQSDPSGRLKDWAMGFVRARPTDTLMLLQSLAEGVSQSLTYQSRDDEGTQSPVETLNRASGSCRDFAVLFVEAARTLGFGARIISGYLNSSDGDLVGNSGAGSTHAWAEAYVPGAGWIAFDPTNRSMGGANLVPVAVARDIKQVMPVQGTYGGEPGLLREMSVEVTVARATAPARGAGQNR